MVVNDAWFQQDGATCHTAREIAASFPDRVISRFGDQNWPARSYDLTPLDASEEIEPHLCKTVIENFNKRAHIR